MSDKRYGIFKSTATGPSPVAILPGDGARDSLHVCWVLHDLCNNRCSYCDESLWGGKKRIITLDLAVFFMTRIFARFPGRRIHVSFTGGEPTLWPDFERFCGFLHSKGCDIGLTSNGSRPASWWERIADLLNWACLSYHPEYASPTRDDAMIRVIETAAPRTRLAIRLMMHPRADLWDRSVAFGERLKSLSPELPLFAEYVPLQKNFAGEKEPWPYEERQQEFFRTRNHFTRGNPPQDVSERIARKRDVWDFWTVLDDGQRTFCRPNDLVASDRVNFKGWSCEVGRELLYVHENGDVSRSACSIGGHIGNIREPWQIRFPESPATCDRDFCPCGTDILVTKRAPGSGGVT